MPNMRIQYSVVALSGARKGRVANQGSALRGIQKTLIRRRLQDFVQQRVLISRFAALCCPGHGRAKSSLQHLCWPEHLTIRYNPTLNPKP